MFTGIGFNAAAQLCLFQLLGGQFSEESDAAYEMLFCGLFRKTKSCISMHEIALLKQWRTRFLDFPHFILHFLSA